MKRIALFAFLLVLSTTTFAQKFFSLGPKAGFTTSKLTTNDAAIVNDFKTNFTGGLFIRLGSRTYVQPEVNFATKGGILNSSNVSFASRTINLKTIEVPILLGSKVFDFGIANFRFLAGPVGTYLLDKEVSFSSVPSVDATIFKELSWSAQAGMGVDILMFTLDVRYEFGLSDLFSEASIDGKTALFNVSLGWKLF